jgi:methionyl-tRNA formyltransferase
MTIPLRVCAVGFKGAKFLSGLIDLKIPIIGIASYPQLDDRSKGYETIAELAARIGVPLTTTKTPPLDTDGITFVVGWQYLFKEHPPNVIVFHDSLLPRYRGFAPTLTAMLNGDTVVGVTALQLAPKVDSGPIVAQRAIPVTYPAKISHVLAQQAGAMVVLAEEIVRSAEINGINGKKQDDAQATYSLWRDQTDYEIDWSRRSEEIARMIDAVGYPYDGARTHIRDLEIAVDDATVVEDLQFERRDVGKVWRLDDQRPVVVCGSGLLRLERFHPRDGGNFSVKLRMRFGGNRL